MEEVGRPINNLAEAIHQFIVLQYRIFQLQRPPFSYTPTPGPDHYPEIDGQALFDLERGVFEGEALLELPVAASLEDFRLRALLGRGRLQLQTFLIKALPENQAESALNLISIDFNSALAAALIRESFDLMNLAVGRPTRKKMIEKHEDQKKEALGWTKAYCFALSQDNAASTEQQEKAEILFHQTDLVMLGHFILNLLRRLLHKQGSEAALRESESVTMHHLYQVAVHTVNDYLAEMKTAESHEEKTELWIATKVDMVTMLLHDAIEDLNLSFEKLRRLCIEATCSTSPFEQDPNYNIFIGHWDEIEANLRALTAPEDRTARKGYMGRQLQTPRQVVMKMRDRTNNLATLKYMGGNKRRNETGPQTQVRKIHETEELVGIAREKLQQTANARDQRRLRRGLLVLCRISKEEIQRLQKLETGEELPEGDIFTKTEAEISA